MDQKELLASEEQFRATIAVMDEGVVLHDAIGAIRFCNDSAARILGLSHDQIIGSTPLDQPWTAIHEDGSPFPGEMHPVMVALRTGQSQVRVLMGVHTPGNTLCWISINAQPLRRAGETQPYAVVASFTDMTAHKLAERRLQESEMRYRQIFENSLDGIALTAPDGRILSVNPAYCRLVGRNAEEICALGRAGVTDMNDPNVSRALDERARTGRFRAELAVLHKDGSRIPVDVSSNVFTGPDGDLRTSMIVRDITQRRQAEDALRTSEARLRIIVEQFPAILWTTDGELRVTSSVGAGLKAMGLQPGQMVGALIPDINNEGEDARAVVESHWRALKGESVAYQATRYGRTIHSHVEPLRDPGGNIIGVIGVSLDISERTMAEKVLQEREQQYRSIIESTTDGLMINDMHGRLVEVNPALCRMTGYDYHEILGIDLATLIHPGGRSFLASFVDTVKTKGEFVAEVTCIRKDSTSFDVEVRGTEFTYRGEPHILGVVRDITEHKRAQQLLEQRVTERTHELATLLTISQTVASLQELRPLLSLILDQLRLVVDYTGASLVTVEGDELTTVAYSGPLPLEQALQRHTPLVDPHIRRLVLEQLQPVAIHEMLEDGTAAQLYRLLFGTTMDRLGQEVQAAIWVPLVIQKRIIGGLGIWHRESRRLTRHHADLALSIANMAAVAIENARLYQRAQDLATLQERQRLARDLHDSVAQTLYSLTLLAEASRRQADAGNLLQAQNSALRLGQLSQQILKEMRLLVYELRPLALAHEGLIGALQLRLDTVERRAGVDAQLLVEGAAGMDGLPEALEATLYRIAQEALNNAMKHAHGTAVVVTLRHEGDTVLLQVTDNGQGFHPSTARIGGLGLVGIHERATQSGGTCEVHSAPGQGTTVQVRLPLS